MQLDNLATQAAGPKEDHQSQKIWFKDRTPRPTVLLDVICHCTKFPAATWCGILARAVLRTEGRRADELPTRMSVPPVTNGDFPGLARAASGLSGGHEGT